MCLRSSSPVQDLEMIELRTCQAHVVSTGRFFANGLFTAARCHFQICGISEPQWFVASRWFMVQTRRTGCTGLGHIINITRITIVPP